MNTWAPKPSRRSVTGDGRISEPDTSYPRLSSTSAMPHMPTPPMPTKWMLRMRRMRRTSALAAAGDLAMGHLQADIHHLAGGIRLGQLPGGTAHGLELLRLHQHLVELCGQPGRIGVCLWQQGGGALACQEFGVAALVIVDGVRQRNQDRVQAGGSQLAHRQRSGAADHKVSPGVGAGYVLDEGHYVSAHPHLVVAGPGDLGMGVAGLV